MINSLGSKQIIITNVYNLDYVLLFFLNQKGGKQRANHPKIYSWMEKRYKSGGD
jgi:hypothetical protein